MLGFGSGLGDCADRYLIERNERWGDYTGEALEGGICGRAAGIGLWFALDLTLSMLECFRDRIYQSCMFW